MLLEDFNGDGNNEIVVIARSQEKAALEVFDGASRQLVFTTAVDPQQGWYRLSSGDVLRDGKRDLILVASGAVPPPSLHPMPPMENGFLWIYPGNGDGTFRDPRTVVRDAALTGARPGDFNGDGALDLVVSRFGPDALVMEGDGDGGFTPAPPLPRSESRSYGGAIAVDLNHDGFDDLVMTGSAPIVLLGGRDGFIDRGAFWPGVYVGGTAVGHFRPGAPPSVVTREWDSPPSVLHGVCAGARRRFVRH